MGSGLHGVTVEGTDDRDEMGVCIEPPDCVIGLSLFEQYLFRTQPEGARSGAGDLDLTVYSLRKWARLAAAGNPTVLLLLFVPPAEIVRIEWPGRELQDRAHLFLSRDAGRRFGGYLDAQRDRMLGQRSQRTNRPELVDVYGFDCYLDDTEFLTDTGWSMYDEVHDGQALATINPSTGQVEFQVPTERVSKPYTGPILASKTRYSEWAVTPNHRMYVSKMQRGACGANPRAYAPDRAGEWSFRPAAAVTTLEWYQQVAAVPRVQDNDSFTDSYLALVGAYVSEGHVAKRRKNGRASALSFCQKDGGRLHDTITMISKQYRLREFRYEPKLATTWTLADCDVAEQIAASCGEGSANKRLPDWALRLSERQANLLLQSLLNGDGTPYRSGGWVYYTISAKLAGDVQAVALLAGRRSNVRGPYESGTPNGNGMYQVLIHDSGAPVYSTFRGRDVRTTVVNERRIVCFTVPNETLVTRRNGHVAMHGNTKFAYHAVRLGIQGVELLTTGRITLPVPEPARSWLHDLRVGKVDQSAVLDAIAEHRQKLLTLTESADLPERPDYAQINDWLIDVYTRWWNRGV